MGMTIGGGKQHEVKRKCEIETGMRWMDKVDVAKQCKRKDKIKMTDGTSNERWTFKIKVHCERR